MAFDKLLSFTQDVSDLADKPALSPTELKAQFDAAPNEIRQYFNDLIDDLSNIGLNDVPFNISNTNLNNLDATGLYRGANLTNAPTVDSYFVLHFKASSILKSQILFRYTTNTPVIYHRTNNGGTWSAFDKITASKEPWIPLTLQSGWVSFGGAYDTPSYRINTFGEIELKGALKSGTMTGGTALATLPVGYRPQKDRSFVVGCNNGSVDVLARVTVQSNGSIVLASGHNSFLTLDGIPPIATT